MSSSNTAATDGRGAADGLRVGVIAVQGDVEEHRRTVDSAAEELDADVETVPVRESGHLPECDVVILPGGESTTISSLVREEGIAGELTDHVEAGKPVLATCAGLIVLARGASDDRVETLGLLDVAVERNAFGRQRASFEADVALDGFDDPFHAVFIRAPIVSEVGDDVAVVGRIDGDVVAVERGPILATSFHTELTDDARLHRTVLEAA